MTHIMGLRAFTSQLLCEQQIGRGLRLLDSDTIVIPARWYGEPARRRLLFGLNIDSIVAHVSSHIRQTRTTRLEPVFDEHQPIGSTGHMRAWLTTRPCEPARRSQISHAVHDSTWE